MALLFVGVAKCVLCGELLEGKGDTVCFPPFSVADKALQRLSDAGAHFSCIQAAGNRGDITTLFCSLIGPERTFPNGTVVKRLSSLGGVQVEVPLQRLEIWHCPLLLGFDLPLKTASLWARSTFWTGKPGTFNAKFADKGFSISLVERHDLMELVIRTCPYAFRPDAAPENLLTHRKRVLRLPDADEAVSDIQQLLQVGMDLAG